MSVVNVTCGGSNLEMKICYDPHPHVNFSTTWVMVAENNADNYQCVGHTVEIDANSSSEVEWCSAGMQALVLDISGEANDLMCGTQLGISVCISVDRSFIN